MGPLAVVLGALVACGSGDGAARVDGPRAAADASPDQEAAAAVPPQTAVDAAAPPGDGAAPAPDAAAAEEPRGRDAAGSPRPRLLVFSRTAGFRHDAIPDAIAAVRRLGAEHGFDVEATESPAAFTDAGLETFDAVAFLLTTGDVLRPDEEAAFERFVRSGRGFVGVHSASDTEYDWPFYGRLVGAYFASHPAIQRARLVVERADHPATAALPAAFERRDEWYNFRANPRPGVTVLVTVDEASYKGGTMGADHPVSWHHRAEGGRAFYTALGHTKESYAEPAFLAHLLGGIRYALGAEP